MTGKFSLHGSTKFEYGDKSEGSSVRRQHTCECMILLFPLLTGQRSVFRRKKVGDAKATLGEMWQRGLNQRYKSKQIGVKATVIYESERGERKKKRKRKRIFP